MSLTAQVPSVASKAKIVFSCKPTQTILVFICRISYPVIHVDTGIYAIFQCKISISPPRGNFDFKFACLGVFAFLGPRPTAPRPHKTFKCWFRLFICLCYKMLMCNISTFANSLSTDISEKQRLQLSWGKKQNFFMRNFYE